MPDIPKDPICGMPVDPKTALSAQANGDAQYFCSELCRQEFLRRQPSGRGLHEVRSSRRIAYLSMEIAADSRAPTYAGGLGVLAGDMLRSCADLRVPIVGVTLLYRKGYFRQSLDALGTQTERDASWDPAQLLHPLDGRAELEIERRRVAVRAWKYEVVGATGYRVPILFLDTDLPENAEDDRRLTDLLYGGDDRYRFAQEIVLGIGGMRILAVEGYDRIQKIHLNEGHASLAIVELLRAQSGTFDFDAVRERCVFTTHTPVPAGHDQFDWGMVDRVLGEPIPIDVLRMLAGSEKMNMTSLALDASHYVNGVARKHGEVSGHMFPGHDIRHITNGVHSVTWSCDAFRALFDRFIPEWRDDPMMLRKALALPSADVWAAHVSAKGRLIDLVNERTSQVLDPQLLTIGFARRSTSYKRADLVFRHLDRLRRLGRGRLQIVFSGKAHPHDQGGKDLIRRIVEESRTLEGDVTVVYVPDYDIDAAKIIVSGVDLWLNTPRRPLEASGTSGMKAAHNGVPSLSILDGWWIEGCIEGLTGWSIGREGDDEADADDLYQKLGEVIVPLFYRDRERWISVMRHAIALNASVFNTHRMVQQYVTNAYLA